jgi:hypothetical protein
MWNVFGSHFGKNPKHVRVIGGIEYLQERADLNAAELTRQWLARGFTRLGSGTYCQYVEEDDVYLVNGFYPKLLHHFSRKGSCIAIFVMRSDTLWQRMRKDFTGTTVPADAVKGSIRRELLDRKAEFGIKEVSPSLNGIHLSAGPVEGLVELLRFTADRTKGENSTDISEFIFGRRLVSEFDPDGIERILNNGVVENNEGETTTFDLTEELDSEDAVSALKSVKIRETD